MKLNIYLKIAFLNWISIKAHDLQNYLFSCVFLRNFVVKTELLGLFPSGRKLEWHCRQVAD